MNSISNWIGWVGNAAWYIAHLGDVESTQGIREGPTCTLVHHGICARHVIVSSRDLPRNFSKVGRSPVCVCVCVCVPCAMVQYVCVSYTCTYASATCHVPRCMYVCVCVCVCVSVPMQHIQWNPLYKDTPEMRTSSLIGASCTAPSYYILKEV